MLLEGDFYTIVREEEDAYVLHLNPEHVIFRSHFPGRPLAPGACIVDMATELISRKTGKALNLKTLSNVKFITPLKPVEGEEVRISFKKVRETEERLRVTVYVATGMVVNAKLVLEYEVRTAKDVQGEGGRVDGGGNGPRGECYGADRVDNNGSPMATVIDGSRPGGGECGADKVSGAKGGTGTYGGASGAMTTGKKICAIIPTYNNARTVVTVIGGVLRYIPTVFVVNDGSTDGTAEVLAGLGGKGVQITDRGQSSGEATGGAVERNPDIRIITHEKNGGKGRALKSGLAAAKAAGFDMAITMDADGQHLPSDIPLFLKTENDNPGAMIIGSRNLETENMPKKNTFANKFSNFWFHVQTGKRLPDTQSGFRLYQLGRMSRHPLLTSRYEAELELLVFQCWKGTEIIPVPIDVHYPPEGERVTHFKPTYDFSRISVLNTILCIFAVVYGLPVSFIRKMKRPAGK